MASGSTKTTLDRRASTDPSTDRPLSKTPFTKAKTSTIAGTAYSSSRNRSANRRYQKLSDILARIPHRNLVADVGCYGGVIFPYLKSAGCKRIEGFDQDESSLEVASKLYDKVYRWNADGEVAPVEAERYEVVVAAEVIEHLLDTDHFLREAHRITKDGGYLLITTPNLTSLNNRVRVLLGEMPFNAPSLSWKYYSDAVDPSHIKIGNLSEWKRVFQRHHFEIADVTGVSKYGFMDILDRLRPTLSGTLILTLKRT